MSTLKVAAVSMMASLSGKEENLYTMMAQVRSAAGQGAKMIVFPDGILDDTSQDARDSFSESELDEFRNVAEMVPEGPSTQALINLARELDLYICWGMVESDNKLGARFFNTAVLVGPEGFVGKYRKVTIGPKGAVLIGRSSEAPRNEGCAVFDTAIGKIGIQINRDLEYEEITYLLAHAGAQIVASLSHWPNVTGSEEDDSHVRRLEMLVKRSVENGVVIVDANRSGEGLDGSSAIVVPSSDKPIAMSGIDGGIAFATVEL